VSLLLAAHAGATTYIVDQSGGGNFTGIQACLNQLTSNNAPGDQCQVKNGTYSVGSGLTLGTVQGTAGDPIQIKAFSGHTPVLNCTGTTICVSLNVNGATASQRLSYVTFEGFELNGGGTSITGLRFWTGDHLVISRNYFHHFCQTSPAGDCGAPIGHSKGKFIVIDRNRFAFLGDPSATSGGDWSVGPYMSGSNWTVTNNLFESITHYAIQCAGYPFQSAIDPDAGYGGFSNSLIANNTVAYTVKRSAAVCFRQNVGADISIQPTTNTYANNLFYENSQLGVGIGQGFHATDAVANFTFITNLSYATAPGDTAFTSGTCTGCTFTNNYCQAGCTTTVGNPNMVNAPSTAPASPNFHLTSGSPARNVGTNLTAQFTAAGVPVVDYDGVARPASGSWDIGAYQFGTPDTTAPAPPTGVSIN
jgi:hypothetical protein